MGSKLIRSRKLLAILLLSGTLVLSGCWDRKELEDTGLVLALGTDKGPRQGYLITVQIAIPSKIGGEQGGGGEGPSTLVTSVEAPTLTGALNLMNAYVGRRLSLMHARALVVGEELARDGQAMGAIMGALARSREVRRTPALIVVKGKAMDFLKENQGIIDANPAKRLEMLTATRGFTGMVPETMYHTFIDDLEQYGSDSYAILGASRPQPLEEGKAKDGEKGQEKAGEPEQKGRETGLRPEQQGQEPPVEGAFTAGNIPREGGAKTELMGTAVFRQARMVGELTGEETRSLNLLKGDFKRAFVSYPDPQGKGRFVSVDLRQGSPPVVNTEISGGKTVIRVKLSLEGELISAQSGANYATDLARQRELEDYIRDIIHTRCLALVRRAQEEFRADIFGFGHKVRHNFSTWDQWVRYDWPARFPEAEIHVSVDFDIRRVGLILAPARFH